MFLKVYKGDIRIASHSEELNRGFRYGDGLFETIKVAYGQIVNGAAHVSRLNRSCLRIGLGFEPAFTLESLRQIYDRFENQVSVHGKLRLWCFRAGEGNYGPESSEPIIWAAFYPAEKGKFELQEQGLRLGIYRDVPLSYTKLSGLKTMGALPYVLAARFAQKEGFDEAVLLDREGFVAEGISSNICLLINGELMAASLYQGGVDGCMMRRIEEVAGSLSIHFYRSYISIKDLEDCDAIYLTNAIQGIQWVHQFKDKTYNSGIASKLIAALNIRLQDPV